MLLIESLALFAVADDRMQRRIFADQPIDRIDDLLADAGIQRPFPLTGMNDIPQDQMMT